ncbi:hypothetical protein [Planctomicrobium piriforme]|uniref:Uncharacterized protein n=1 Tax=Planctomicrobium piriforme TaxID=1576369 RepID=A0A1I3BMK9_9PLAN|nr:hypothetical protein [Planctomicrobium piriforme]SFH63139.1 hypothetical protein SAMN05421753_101522 [Planctomicrobium piriforme]
MDRHFRYAEPYTHNRRGGIHIRGARGPREVREAYKRYARWLRQRYPFPIFVPVYLSPHETITTIHGEICSASFFYWLDPTLQPHIRVATGDYSQLRKERGRDNALAEMLHSLSHELVHYWQWLERGDTTERGVVVRAWGMVNRYAQDVDHP